MIYCIWNLLKMNYIDCEEECTICKEVVTKNNLVNSSKCKCSGTIENIHDDCLFELLIYNSKDAVNKLINRKQVCNVCKTQYIFSKYIKIKIFIFNLNIDKLFTREKLFEDIRNYKSKFISENDIECKNYFTKIQRKQKYLSLITLSLCLCLYLRYKLIYYVDVILFLSIIIIPNLIIDILFDINLIGYIYLNIRIFSVVKINFLVNEMTIDHIEYIDKFLYGISMFIFISLYAVFTTYT